jgi:hypothetical protein
MKRRLLVLVVVALVLGGMAVPTTATHGAPIDGVWTATDTVDGSRMMLKIKELKGDSGFFRVVFTDLRATGGCDPAAVFRAFSTTATYDDGNGRFFAPFAEIRCFGRRSVPTLDFVEMQFWPQDDGTMIDALYDIDENEIGGGNVWRHLGG